MITKEERRKQIIEESKRLVAQREVLRRMKASLDIELDYIRGNFDISWEDKYGEKQ